MAAITNPGTNATEFAGDYKMVSFYNLALTTADDTLTLTAAANGISEIQNVMSCANAGTDANFQVVGCRFSGLVIRLNASEGDGTQADEFTGTTCNLIVIGK